MATATVTGYITANSTEGGSSTNVMIGSPTITPSSTTAFQETYDDSLITTYSIPTAPATTISLGTISDCDLLYIGSTTEVTAVLNGASTFTIGADGFVMLAKASITSLTLEATTSEASVSIAAFGT